MRETWALGLEAVVLKQASLEVPGGTKSMDKTIDSIEKKRKEKKRKLSKKGERHGHWSVWNAIHRLLPTCMVHGRLCLPEPSAVCCAH